MLSLLNERANVGLLDGGQMLPLLDERQNVFSAR